MAMIFRTSRKERVSFALFMTGQSLFNTFVGSFVQVFYTNMGIAAITVGFIFLAARVWDAANDPMFGAIVDRSNLKRGKFLPWLRLSSFLVPLFMILIFALPSSLPMTAKLIWATAAYILYGMAYTVCDVPIFSMTSAITDQVQERVIIMSRNALCAGIATVVVMLVATPMYLSIGWMPTALVIAVPATLFMFLFTRYGKERYVNKNAEPVTLKSML
ncbi:MAG: MFS transporter, partial [Treponema sp.]|nr:MFS transporter [Treponema sp.]